MTDTPKRADSSGAPLQGNISTVLTTVVEQIQANHDAEFSPWGIRTGIPELDRHFYGLRPGELIALGGRPGMGHEPLARRIALHVATVDNLPVVFVSMSYDKSRIGLELLSIIADIEPTGLSLGQLDDEGWEIVGDALGRLHRVPIAIESIEPKQHADLSGLVRRRCADFGQPPGLIVMEGLDLLSVPGAENCDGRRRADTIWSLRSLAKDLRAPILLLTSLDPKLENREDLRPRLGDLPPYGHLEWVADRVLLLYRHDYYFPHGSSQLELKIARNYYEQLGSLLLDPLLGCYGRRLACPAIF